MIEIGFSCPESFDDMPKVDCGLYCDSCNRVVHDFTGKNEAEIRSILNADASIVCGVFDEKVARRSAKSAVYNMFKMAFVAVFLLGFNATVLFGQDVEAPPVEINTIKHRKQDKPRINLEIVLPDSAQLDMSKLRVLYNKGDKYVNLNLQRIENVFFDLEKDELGKSIVFYVYYRDMDALEISIDNILAMEYTYKLHFEKRKHYPRHGGVMLRP